MRALINLKIHKSAQFWSEKVYLWLTPSWEDPLPAHTVATHCSHFSFKSNPAVLNVNHTPILVGIY